MPKGNRHPAGSRQPAKQGLQVGPIRYRGTRARPLRPYPRVLALNAGVADGRKPVDALIFLPRGLDEHLNHDAELQR